MGISSSGIFNKQMILYIDCLIQYREQLVDKDNLYRFARIAKTWADPAPKHHKWLKVSLEILVCTSQDEIGVKGGSHCPL